MGGRARGQSRRVTLSEFKQAACMTFVYMVRCKFTAPDREAAWNAWYSGPKIVQMLTQPYFRTCQRFRRSAGTGRDYLALWVVTSPEALATRQYRSQWGFAEWQPLITDWSRDLFDGGGRPEQAFAVQPQGSLRVVSFDGASEDEARSASAGQTDLMWLPVIGLDRHTPMIGLAPQSGSAAAPQNALPRAQAAVYRPISPLYTAAKSS
jgi:hypothetical protein